MRIASVESSDLFVGTRARPLQVVRVNLVNAGTSVAGPADAVTVTVHGPTVSTPEPVLLTGLAPGAEVTAEVGVEIAAPAQPGSSRPVLATVVSAAGTTELAAVITVAEPGWVMWMVSHFHYDPVWWNTQGQFLETRLLLPDEHGEMPEVRTAFELVRLHLDAARRDPDYKFVLAEIDYLKPHFDAHPEDRADLLDFIKAGRIELVGGTYNEPNTNLTCAESTIRNVVYGLAYQRGVLGGRPSTAWMLDAFGFDPGYPGLMAAAGLTESSWARGPFHQWGPNRVASESRLMQFGTEFEWLSPDGTGLLTSYMANHYSAGWLAGHHAKTLQQAEADACQQFSELARVATTRNVLLPVGGDHVIPPRWATPIHRDWNARYVWPRFVTAVPAEFFAAVRAEAADRGLWITPQTRDMNPVYTGKDVTYIDTKQGQRAAEVAVLDGERLATLAWLAGASYPAASLDKAWRQLVFGAHHDAITGTEGDQVYLDLVGGWREAWERGDQARRGAITHLAGLADTTALSGTSGAEAAPAGPWPEPLAIVVVNSLSLSRAAMASVRLECPPGWPRWLELTDDSGIAVPFLAEAVSRSCDGGLAAVTLTFRAESVPGVGYRSYLVRPSAATGTAGWQPDRDEPAIENEAFALRADPARGGTLSYVLDKRTGTELLRAGGGGNELLLQPEHAAHPRWGEGPWLLCPAGPGDGSTSSAAAVRAERCPVGSRLVAEFELGGLRVTQESLLWDGSDRVEFRTHVDGSIGSDNLLRVRFPAAVAGGLPVYQTAVSVVGRPPGDTDIDVAEHWYTLDSPASEWFAVGSTARVALPGAEGSRQLQAIGVAEVVCPPALRESARELLAALAAQGVTATCSVPDGPRYGYLHLDSNLPDFRVCLGGPDQNAFTAEVLAAAGPTAAGALTAQLAGGSARLWLAATRTRSDAFGPGADVRGPLDLPVLIVAAANMAAEIGALVADLGDAVIEASAAGGGNGAGGPATALAGHTVALLNRGTPSGLVTPDGALTMALMRACSTWPCGVWIDGQKRTVPDGTSFAWQHWSHTFEYALAAGEGDWRTCGFAAAGQDYNHDLQTVVTGLHAGPLPATAALVTIRPQEALLSALKPFGNPLAPAGQPAATGGITARLRDIGGGSREARVQLHPRLRGGLAAASLASLCEDSTGGSLPVRDGEAVLTVPAAGIVTAVLTPADPDAGQRPGVLPEAGPLSGRPPEPAQPVYARYWLHGKGPAPAGNMPVAVHLSPAQIPLDGGGWIPLRLTVACGPNPASGLVELTVPDGIAVEPAGPFRYDLAPLGYLSWDLTAAAVQGANPSRAFVTAQVTDACGQTIEDSVLVTVGQPVPPGIDLPLLEVAEQQQAAEAAQAGEIELTVAAGQLTLAPGETRPVEVTIANRCAGAIRGEAQLISPYGSWHQAGPWTTGFSLAPGARTTLHFTVAAAPGARRGEQWWAIVKVMYFGRLCYTEPVQVTIA
jgi:alpha-mannosidase